MNELPEERRLFCVGSDRSIFKLDNGLSVFLRFEGFWTDAVRESFIWKKIENGDWRYFEVGEIKEMAKADGWKDSLSYCLSGTLN